MPIRIRVDVNGQDERTFWIGRMEGGTRANDLNTYVIGQETVTRLEPWNVVRPETLPHFTHRYGDGLLVCVEKGLARWNELEE